MCPPAGSTSASAVLPAPRRADGLVLLGLLHGSGHLQSPGLVRRADGQTVQVTGLLHALLECLDGVAGPQTLARRLSETIDRDVSGEDVLWLLENKLRPAGLLQEADGSAPVPARANPLLALRLKKVVTDPAVTDRITAPFAPLFQTWIVLPVLAAFAATVWFVLVEKGLASAARGALYEPGLLLAVVALTVLSAGFHELGHAAACRYGGARPGAMGVAVYLVWPAFYTDVDDSYRLSRWGRLRVDLGGLYFNCLVAVAIMGTWLVWREDALLLGVATQLLQMLRQLAPVVRADGYHILADLTGVPDLFAHMKPTLLALVPSRRGPRPVVQLKRWARVVVTVWVLVVVPVLLGLLALAILLLPRLAATAWGSAGLHTGLLLDEARALDPVAVGARLLTLVALVLPVAGIVYLLTRIVRSTWTAGWRLSEGRPPLRVGLILTAVVVGALTVLSWVPDQQRTPIRAAERGTLADVPVQVPALLPAARVPAGAAAPPAGGAPSASTARGTAAAGTSGPVVARASRPVVGPPSPLGPPRQARALAARPAVAVPAAVPTVLAAAPGRQFRFALPAAPGPQGQQVLALGKKDGATVHEVAYGMLVLTDPGTVDATNEAYALASCTGCTTSAVAFQVVLVVGDAPVVIPLNAAVAANDQCVACLTSAVAVQLVATLTGTPAPQVEAQLRRTLAGLAPLRSQRAAGLGAEGLYAAVKAVEQQVIDVLLRAGLVSAEDVLSTTRRDGAGSVAPAVAGPPTAPVLGPVVSGPAVAGPVAPVLPVPVLTVPDVAPATPTARQTSSPAVTAGAAPTAVGRPAPAPVVRPSVAPAPITSTAPSAATSSTAGPGVATTAPAAPRLPLPRPTAAPADTTGPRLSAPTPVVTSAPATGPAPEETGAASTGGDGQTVPTPAPSGTSPAPVRRLSATRS